MRTILICGTGADVIEKKRGEFIDDFFDDILVCNRQIFHLDQYKEYFGTPTIWGTCGWNGDNVIEDPPKEQRDQVHGIIESHPNIREVWLNGIDNRNHLGFTLPDYIAFKNIVNTPTGAIVQSLGFKSLMWAIEVEQYDCVAYMGIDSYRKSHHYYDDDPPEILDIIHGQCLNYLSESRIIKRFVSESRLWHIDSV